MCPPCEPLSLCIFCNMRTSGSELGAMTQEETGSPEHGQQDALTDTISKPADMIRKDSWGEICATLHLG